MPNRLSSPVLVGLLLIYLLLTLAISQVTPFNKGPDEETNLAYIEFITRYGRLPITYEERELVGKDANWPALYHLMAAGLSNLAAVDLDNGPIIKTVWDASRYRTLDTGSEETFYLRTEDQVWPYHGRFLVWQLGRLLSIGWGLVTLLLIYGLVRELPRSSEESATSINRTTLSLFAVGLLAFQPVYVFISSVLNEDTLMAALTTLYLWLLMRFIKQPHKSWLLAGAGLVLGLSITIKYTTIILPPHIVGLILYLKWQHGFSGRWVVGQTMFAGLMTLLGTAWWFGWNFWYLNEIDKYGLYVGLLRPIFTGGPDVTLARLGYLLSGGVIGLAEMPPRDTTLGTFPEWFWFTTLSFWGVSAGGVWPGFPVMFLLVALMVTLAAGGWLILWRRDTANRVWLLLFGSHIGLFIILPIIRFWLSRRIGETAQGRHILIPAVAPIILLLVWGLATVIPPRAHRATFSVIVILFCGWSLAHWHRLATFEAPPLPFRTYAYVAPSFSQPAPPAMIESLELVGYRLIPQPDQAALEVDLAWTPNAPVQQNYLLELRLMDIDHQVVSQWLGHPGQGRVPTLAWAINDTIYDRLRLPIPNLPAGDYKLQLQFWVQPASECQPADSADQCTLPPPTTPFGEPLSLPVNLTEATRPILMPRLWDSYRPGSWWEGLFLETDYHYRYPGTITVMADEPVELVAESSGTVWQPIDSSVNSHHFVIGPRWQTDIYQLQTTSGATINRLKIINWWARQFDSPPDIATPLTANFANQLHLLGYTLPQTQVEAGEAFPLTLYWQAPAHRSPEANFVQFNSLLDDQGRLWGGYERQPLEYYSTLLWAPGEVVVDGYTVPVDPAAPPGTYYLNVGYYIIVGASPVNLPLVVEGAVTEQSSVTIGPIEVVE